MANVSTNGMGWMGTSSACASVQLSSLTGNLRKAWTVGLTGNYLADGYPTENPIVASWPAITCGTAFYLSSETGVTYDVANVSFVQKGTDRGRITSFYIPNFLVTGDNFSQEFKLTTSYTTDGSPVYKSSSKYIWSNGSAYLMSDAVGDENGAVNNGSCHPNYWNPLESHGLKGSPAGEATGITEQSMSSANGFYVQIGHFNGKPSYAHIDCDKDWVLYFNGSQYLLSDQRFNTSGISVGNGSGNAFNPCSVADYGGGCITSTDEAEGSLATEDLVSVLVTEDLVSVLVDESAQG